MLDLKPGPVCVVYQFILCLSYVYLMLILCLSYVYHMLISCLSDDDAYLLFILCLSVYLMLNLWSDFALHLFAPSNW